MNLIRSARARDPFVADHDHEKCSFGNKGPFSLSLSLSVRSRSRRRSFHWGLGMDAAGRPIEN